MKKLIIMLSIIIYPLSCFAVRTKEERKALFSEATANLKKGGIENKVLKVGDTFPNLLLGGKKVSSWLLDGPLVISFYRGGWCPYCVKQLKELESSISEIKDSKARLIAISPEKDLEVKKTKSKNNLSFLLLSDYRNKLAQKLGLVFKVDPRVVEEYKTLGIDLIESQGNSRYELPMPATFIITRKRKIVFMFADADYTKRADTNEIIEKLKSIK